jgi:lysozyme
MSDALALPARDLRADLQQIKNAVSVPLSASEEAALASFVCNVGISNFEASTMLKLLNAGNYAAAAKQFLRWDHAAGVVMAGLARRRAAEEKVFETP